MPFCGALNRGGPDVLDRVQQCMARLARPGESVSIWRDGVLALGIGGDTRILERDGLVVLLDGVLWERDEIQAALGLREASDEEIVARAYRRWGDQFPKQLNGAFAFAVWEPSRRRLVVGRDTAGGRSLFYAQAGGTFLFTSEIAGLMCWPEVDVRIHEPTVAVGICNMFPEDRERTLFEGIRALPPATILSIEDGRLTKSQYWDPLAIPEWRGAGTQDYAQAIRATMKDAVARRLPAGKKIGTHLSSGWDSSTVTSLAAQILAEQGRELTAYTSVPATPVPDEIWAPRGYFPDESKIAAVLAARYPNVEHVRIPNTGYPRGEAMAVRALAVGRPFIFRSSVWLYAIHREGQRRGDAVLLSGGGGNMTTSYTGGFELWSLGYERRWLELLKAIRTRIRHTGRPLSVLAQAVPPDSRIHLWRQRLRGRKPPTLANAFAVNPDLMRRCGYSENAVQGSNHLPGHFPRGGRELRARATLWSDIGGSQGYVRRAFGIENFDPTIDRRVVELCLSIPDEAYAPEGRLRELPRQAFARDLPPEVLNEKRRGFQSADFCARFDEEIPWLRAQLDRMKQSPTIGGFLDLKAMQAMLDAWPGAAAASFGLDLEYSVRFGNPFGWGYLLLLLEERGGRL